MVAHIPEVELDAIGPRQGGAAVDLRPAGDAWLHVETMQLLLVVGVDLVAEGRPRPDHRHVAAHDVPELRQLIDADPPQHTTRACDASVALVDREAGALRLGALDHRPQLQELEVGPVLADSRLPIEDSAPILELHRERTEREERACHDEAEARDDDVERSVHTEERTGIRGSLSPLSDVEFSERFFSRPMALALGGYGLFAVTFSHFQIKGDGLVYFNLLQRFFGEHPDSAFAYQFGSDVWNAPFFLLGKVFAAVFGFQPKTFHVSFEEISIVLAANAALVTTLYFGWRILRELDLPRSPGVLFATAFGSPLFYYVIFEPGSKHAADTLIITVATFLFLRVLDVGERPSAVALGALAGVSLNVRYVNVGFFLVIFGVLVVYRRRQALYATGAAALVGAAVFVLPALRGISYFVPTYFPKSQAIGRLALGAHPTVGTTSNPLNGFDPMIPLKMLFSIHRGLFLWTPLTALAVVGFVLVLRKTTDVTRRRFLSTLLMAALALLLVHTIWGQWDGGFAFSQRFLTSLFPLFLIGVAELRQRLGLLVYPALVVCIAWSLTVAFVHDIGYDGVGQHDGIDRIGHVIRTDYAHKRHQIDARAIKRWRYLWALTQGNDPEHVHGP